MIFPSAKPNPAHLALAKLEQEGKLKAVITQNIDGLHQLAGSKEVLELHGSVHRNFCTRCGKFYTLDQILAMDGVPYCECGGIIKPDVVLYEEGLDQQTLKKAVSYISGRCSDYRGNVTDGLSGSGTHRLLPWKETGSDQS